MTKEEREKRNNTMMRYRYVFDKLTSNQREQIIKEIKSGKTFGLRELELIAWRGERL